MGVGCCRKSGPKNGGVWNSCRHNKVGVLIADRGLRHGEKKKKKRKKRKKRERKEKERKRMLL